MRVCRSRQAYNHPVSEIAVIREDEQDRQREEQDEVFVEAISAGGKEADRLWFTDRNFRRTDVKFNLDTGSEANFVMKVIVEISEERRSCHLNVVC